MCKNTFKTAYDPGNVCKIFFNITKPTGLRSAKLKVAFHMTEYDEDDNILFILWALWEKNIPLKQSTVKSTLNLQQWKIWRVGQKPYNDWNDLVLTGAPNSMKTFTMLVVFVNEGLHFTVTPPWYSL